MLGIKPLNLFQQIEGHGKAGKQVANNGHQLPITEPTTEGTDPRPEKSDASITHAPRAEEKALLRFRQMIQNTETETLDIPALTRHAPGFVKEFAQHNNMELPNLIERIAQGQKRMQMNTFRNALFQGNQRSAEETEALAGQAPAALKQFAQRHAIELESMISQLPEQHSRPMLHIPGMGPGMFIQAGNNIHRTDYAQMESRIDALIERIFAQDA